VFGALGELILSLAGAWLGTIVRRGRLPLMVRRMLLAWKKAQRLEDSTFLLIDSVWAPLPSVSDNARQSAMTAIRSAIFLFSPDA